MARIIKINLLKTHLTPSKCNKSAFIGYTTNYKRQHKINIFLNGVMAELLEYLLRKYFLLNARSGYIKENEFRDEKITVSWNTGGNSTLIWMDDLTYAVCNICIS